MPTVHLSLPWNASDLDPSGMLGLWLAYGVFLFGYLYRILTRTDFDAPNKILWVLVVVLVPVLGMVLYLVAAPAAPLPAGSPRRAPLRSDVSGTPWDGRPGSSQAP